MSRLYPQDFIWISSWGMRSNREYISKGLGPQEIKSLSQWAAQALSSLLSPDLASHYHSGRLRLCRLCCRQPSPPTITAGGLGFVVFVVASPRLPLSQWAAQALSSLLSPALASHYHSGRLSLCPSLLLPALASHYHSGRLRLCRLCCCQPSPPAITAGGSGFVIFVIETASHYHSGKLPRAPILST